jgi:hypothetical protein
MFRSFLNWPSSGWNTVQEVLYNYYNITIGGRDLAPPPNDYVLIVV